MTTPEKEKADKPTEEQEAQPSMLKQAGKWYLTALLVFVLVAIGLVAYLVKYRPQEFFYVWF